MKRKYAALVYILVFLFLGCVSGFTEDDINKCKKSIKSEFEKRRGVTVTEVNLIKESSKKLTGFAKMNVSILGEEIEVMKSCTANMGEDGQYIWKCE